MTDRPILFSAPMIRAILAGTKTQTRRVVKPQPDTRPGMNCTRLIFKDRKGAPLLDEALEAPEPVLYRSLCPYGRPGDRLWVRETWTTHACFDDIRPRDLTTISLHYQADGQIKTGKLRPSIHMPRWASRITLDVTAVRVERLQHISEADADAECFGGDFPGKALPELFPGPPNRWSHLTMVQCYQRLWDSINGPGSWDANPFVWVVEFRKISDAS